jgi:hypothetical protein
MLRPGRPEAAMEIWDFRGQQAPGEEARRRARLRGCLQAAVAVAVGGLLLALGHRAVGGVVLGVASLVALAALLSPLGAFAAIERAFGALGHWMGQLLTWMLLPVVFYLFFVPFGWLFRRGRRDSMRRYFEAEAPSYWTDRERGRAGSAQRARQY